MKTTRSDELKTELMKLSKGDCVTVSDMISLRKKYLSQYRSSWDKEKEVYTIDEPWQVDELAECIIEKIIEEFTHLQIDFVIESLTTLGDSPNILYDDNGRFACIGDGLQSVCEDDGPDDIEMHFYTEKRQWFGTVREAVWYYLTYEEPEEEGSENNIKSSDFDLEDESNNS